MKKIFSIIMGLVIIVGMATSCSNYSENSKLNSDSLVKASTAKADSLKVEARKKEVKDLIGRLNIIEYTFAPGALDGSSYRSSVEKITNELRLFNYWRMDFDSVEKIDTGDYAKTVVKLRKQLMKLQKQEFPQIRKAYAEIIAGTMWEYNIYCTASGNGYTVLNMTGGDYASNSEIKKTQATIRSFVTRLRFKEVRYRWYKGADEFTYYKLESSPDDDITDYD
jgi:hypothetical protein